MKTITPDAAITAIRKKGTHLSVAALRSMSQEGLARIYWCRVGRYGRDDCVRIGDAVYPAVQTTAMATVTLPSFVAVSA